MERGVCSLHIIMANQYACKKIKLYFRLSDFVGFDKLPVKCLKGFFFKESVFKEIKEVAYG